MGKFMGRIMTHGINRLSARAVETAKSSGLIADGGGAKSGQVWAILSVLAVLERMNCSLSGYSGCKLWTTNN